MKRKFMLFIKDRPISQSLKFLAIGIVLLLISVSYGKFGSTPNVMAFFCGCVLIFYGMLRPWEKVLYYTVLCILCIVLIILEFNFGIDIVVDMYKGDKQAEDILWSMGGVFLAGAVAGLTGIFSFYRREK